jgi:hypothetical protein
MAEPLHSEEIIWLAEGIPAIRGRVGSREGLLLIDTAAAVDLIDASVAQNLASTSFGVLTGSRMTGEQLQVPLRRVAGFGAGARVEKDAVAGIFDIASHLAPSRTPVIGAVSLSFFEKHPVTLDFPRNLVSFESPVSLKKRASEPAASLVLRRFSPAGVDGFVRITIDGGEPRLFEIDTASTAVLTRPSPGVEECERNVGFADLPSVRARVPVYVRSIVHEGVLGIPFLRRFSLTFDIAGRKLWMRPAAA